MKKSTVKNEVLTLVTPHKTIKVSVVGTGMQTDGMVDVPHAGNERGDVYRVIKVFGMKEFSDLIEKFHKLGFNDEFAETYGDKEGYDAVISGPARV